MSRHLQFAFLGCHNSYLASVTWVNQAGCPYEPPAIACYGLPPDAFEEYQKFASNRYIYNVRGHDCFAYFGEWTKEATKGHTPTSSYLLAEIDALRKLATDNKTNDPPYREEDILLSLGPAPGGFFADAFRLKRYRWANLPMDLENEIQKEVCRKGYGTIYDISVNAAGGWVMQLEKGKNYRWGGLLPAELESALSEGRGRKGAIKQLYLNHQNKYDYVLIFTDGSTHVSLHYGFEDHMRELIESTFPKREKVKWHFIASCYCNEELQRHANATYYNQRGRYQIRRLNVNHALTYLREAYHLDHKNTSYRDDYYMALVAARKHESLPEDDLTRFDSKNALNNEYGLMRERMGSTAILEERLRDVFREAEQERLPNEWSYDDTAQAVVELAGDDLGTRVFELGNQRDSILAIRDGMSSKDSSRRLLRFWR